MNEEKVIAVFDFDDTITTEKTLYDFISFYHTETKALIGYIVLSTVRLLEILNLISKEKAYQITISYFFKGQQIDEFEKKAKDYASRLMEITNPHALEKIHWHQNNGHTVVVESSACEDWVIPWAKMVGINNVIATKLEVSEGKLTGRINGKECYGKEKIIRLLELFPDRNSYTLYVYGDNKGDKDLLDMADYPFFRKF